MDYLYRRNEINEIDRLRWLSSEQFTRVLLLCGIPGSGKTLLVNKALEGSKLLRFRIGSKSEAILCREFMEQAYRVLGIEATNRTFNYCSVLDLLFDYSSTESFSLVLEEFQKLPQEALSHLAEILEQRKRKTNVNCILESSDILLSEKLTDPADALLYNCLDSLLVLDTFSPVECKDSFFGAHSQASKDDFLKFYMVTGGLPSLVSEYLSSERLFEDVFRDGSMFLDLGDRVLSPILGKSSELYFSVLQAIACGYRSQAEIQDYIGSDQNVGGHLMKLESIYNIIQRRRPAFNSDSSRGVVRYYIKDQYLDFWFRYVERYRSDLSKGDYSYVIEQVESDYSKYSVEVLSRYFRKKLLSEGGFNSCSGWWRPTSRSGGKDDFEIPVVATSLNGKRILLAEVCINAESFDKDNFLKRVTIFKNSTKIFSGVESVLFVLEDI